MYGLHVSCIWVERDGYTLAKEDALTWTLYKHDAEHPLINLPKEGPLLSVTIMMAVVNDLKLSDGRYRELLAQADGAEYLD